MFSFFFYRANCSINSENKITIKKKPKDAYADSGEHTNLIRVVNKLHDNIFLNIFFYLQNNFVDIFNTKAHQNMMKDGLRRNVEPNITNSISRTRNVNRLLFYDCVGVSFRSFYLLHIVLLPC